jgi:hypothetical protein
MYSLDFIMQCFSVYAPGETGAEVEPEREYTFSAVKKVCDFDNSLKISKAVAVTSEAP